MYENVFEHSTDLQERLTGDAPQETKVSAVKAPVMAAAQPSTPVSDEGSFWSKLFDFLFGWLSSDSKSETEVEAPASVTPEPELELELELEPILVAEETPAASPNVVVEEPTGSSSDAPTTDSPANQIAATALDGSGAVSIAGGRVTTFALPDAANITGITINNLPAHGNVTVNPDFTLALVLSGSDYAGPLSFDYTVSRSDGTSETLTATLDVAAPTQAAGWGLGNHYMLETDADDNIVVEHGDNHRKVYVSGSEDALTRADIAALEDVSESVITMEWLRNNPEYGGSEGWALAEDVARDVVSGLGNGTSVWVFLERGYEYNTSFISRNTKGESDLHPRLITSWGSGDKPVITPEITVFNEPAQNIVMKSVAIEGGMRMLTAENILFEDVTFTENQISIQAGQGPITGITIRNSEFVDISKEVPFYDNWSPHSDRSTGLFASGVSGLLIEGTLAYHNGWSEGYDETALNGQPPSMFSHNLYIQASSRDVTFRDNITAQAASYGVMLRPGAFAENNVFLDNNASVEVLGGNYNPGDGPAGNFTLFLDNLFTSAAFKSATQIGALDWGIRNQGVDTTLLGNIVTHKADPNNPDEIAYKSTTNHDPANNLLPAFFDDTIVFNWNGYEANLDGLDPADLNQITIQNFAMEFLGLDPSTAPASEDMGLYYKSGLIYALMDYARENWGDGTLTTQDIIDYFQEGFNIAAEATGDTHHRFIPNDLGDGVRWDNRLNWSSDALPSDGDTVDLGGNWVNFSDTVTLAGLDLGTGGKLQVGSGKLSVDMLETGDNGAIFVERAGQVWADGYSGDAALSLQVTGGRFANTGDLSGPVGASVQGGQMILATDDANFTLGQDSTLQIDGTEAKVGFDGDTGGVATMTMQDGGQLSFIASADGLGRVNEFRSGAWEQEGSNVHSGIVLDGTLALDLSDYIGTGSMKLVEVDAIAGMFDDVDIHGLGDNRDAELVIDYAADLVTLELSAGTGQGSVSVIGDATDGSDENAALWNELTEGLGQGDEPDTSVTVFDDTIDALPDLTFI